MVEAVLTETQTPEISHLQADSPTDSSLDFMSLPELQVAQQEMTPAEMRGALVKLGFEFHPKITKSFVPVNLTDERLTI